MGNATDPLELVSRFAAGDRSPEVLGWLQSGLAVWAWAGGAVSLERALKLPNTPGRVRRLQRDFWLRKVADLMGEPTPWLASVAAARELDQFLSRGPWSAWRDLAAPPDGASALRSALFWLAKSNLGRSTTAEHMSRILGHFFIEKCRTDAATIRQADSANDTLERT